MPFEKQISTSLGPIGIWKLSEPSEKLLELSSLSVSDRQSFTRFTSERRKKEFLATRILLDKLDKKKHQIIYDEESGKPSLKNSLINISISHSADFVTVMLSEKRIGIDIEQTTRNIDRVATRFLHPDEQKFISALHDQQKAKTLFWAAKEAIFKCTDVQGIEFNEQIIITPFELSDEGSFSGYFKQIEKKINYRLYYSFLVNNVLVFCVEQ